MDRITRQDQRRSDRAEKECLGSVHKPWRLENEVIITPAPEENMAPALLRASEGPRYQSQSYITRHSSLPFLVMSKNHTLLK